MIGKQMDKKIFVIFLGTISLYDGIFVYLNYSAEHRYLHSLFPPKFFHVVFSQTVIPKNPCAWLGTCARKKQKHSLPNCYCDSECQEYDDCCFDAIVNSTSEQESPPHVYKQFLNCETEALHDNYFGILMVSDCPAEYEFSEISEKCSLNKNIYPVSAYDGTTFRNVYCAYCHNVQKYNAWRFEYTKGGNCYGTNLVNGTISSKMRYAIENDCFYQFLPPPNAKFRSCLKHVLRDAADNSSCSKFQNPIKISNRLFRNIFCYNESQSRNNGVCLPSYKRLFEEGRGYSSLQLTGIFNIRPVLYILGRKICEDNYIYDVKKDACIPKNCNEEMGDDCDVELIRNYKFTKPLIYVTNNTIDNAFILRLSSFIYLSLPTKPYQISILHSHGQRRCMADENESCCLGTIDIMFSVGIEMTTRQISRLVSDVINMKWSYTEVKDKTVVSALNVTDNSNLTATCYISGESSMMYLHRSIAFSALVPRIVTNVPKNGSRSLVIPALAEGLMVVVNETSLILDLRFENLKLQPGATNESNHRNFNSSSEDDKLNNDWSVGTIMTYITMATSCCFLVITICVYSHFGLFQSSSGVKSKYMMVTMLAAQLLFIAGVGANDITAACIVIGIISHYLWLSSFTWISLILFSILKMIRMLQSCPGALQSGQKVSKMTYFLGFLMPLVFVLPCSLLDLLSNEEIGYSDGDICFPTGFLGNLFSFSLPVFLSLCFNIIVLIIASVLLSRYNDTVHLLQSARQARSNIPIYMRLTVLCAFPWILGIIADILPFDVLRYIYILFAGSHGTFVGLSFLVAESVRTRIGCTRQTKATNDIQLGRL